MGRLTCQIKALTGMQKQVGDRLCGLLVSLDNLAPGSLDPGGLSVQ